MRTAKIVHYTEVDTYKKIDDMIKQLVMRLERRANRQVWWAAVGPVPVRNGQADMYFIGVWERICTTK